MYKYETHLHTYPVSKCASAVDYPCFYCTLKDVLMQVYFACFIVFFADLIFNKTLCALL